MYYALEKTIDKGIDKLMPGNIGPSKKEISKYIIDGLRGRGKGKQILDQEFNLGKSILSQGASLKMKIAEHTIDTVIERNKQIQDSRQEEQTK